MPVTTPTQPIVSMPRMETRSAHSEHLLLAAVMVLALLLRLRGFTTFSFEQDELYTVMEGRDLFNTTLAPGIEARPLYFLLQHVLLKILPETHAGLRIVPLIFGMLGVWVTAILGKRVFGSRAGIAAAFLVAISPWHLHASSFARYWSMLYLLAAVFMLFLWDAYTTGRKRSHVIAMLALIAGSATHPSFVFAAFGAAIGTSLIREDGRFGLRLPSKMAWMYLWGPYLLFIGAAFITLKLTGNSGSVQNWAGRGFVASLRLIPAVIEWLTPTIALSAFIGAIVALRSRNTAERRWGSIAIAAAIIGLSLLFVASLRTDIYADYAMPITPLVYVSVAGLLAITARQVNVNQGLAFTIATILVASAVLPSTASHLSDGTRFDYRPALNHVRAAAPQVTVVTWPYVLATKYAPDLKIRGLRMNEEFLNTLLNEEGELFVVASVRRHGMVEDYDGRITRWLSNNCTWERSDEGSRWDYRTYRVDLHRCRRGPLSP